MSSLQAIKVENNTLLSAKSRLFARNFSVKPALPLSKAHKNLSAEKRNLVLNSSSGPEDTEIKSGLADINTGEILSKITEKWEAIDDKASFITFSTLAIITVGISSSVLDAFDNLPFFPKLFQLVGLVYVSWFIYRYLLFKSARAELKEDFNRLKSRIFGDS